MMTVRDGLAEFFRPRKIDNTGLLSLCSTVYVNLIRFCNKRKKIKGSKY